MSLTAPVETPSLLSFSTLNEMSDFYLPLGLDTIFFDHDYCKAIISLPGCSPQHQASSGKKSSKQKRRHGISRRKMIGRRRKRRNEVELKDKADNDASTSTDGSFENNECEVISTACEVLEEVGSYEIPPIVASNRISSNKDRLQSEQNETSSTVYQNVDNVDEKYSENPLHERVMILKRTWPTNHGNTVTIKRTKIPFDSEIDCSRQVDHTDSISDDQNVHPSFKSRKIEATLYTSLKTSPDNEIKHISISSSKAEEPHKGKIESLCRLCGRESTCLTKLYSTEACEPDLVRKINFHLSVKVQRNDVLPLNVCSQCTINLNTFDEFYKNCIEADTLLRKTFLEPDAFQTNWSSGSVFSTNPVDITIQSAPSEIPIVDRITTGATTHDIINNQSCEQVNLECNDVVKDGGTLPLPSHLTLKKGTGTLKNIFGETTIKDRKSGTKKVDHKSHTMKLRETLPKSDKTGISNEKTVNTNKIIVSDLLDSNNKENSCVQYVGTEQDPLFSKVVCKASDGSDSEQHTTASCLENTNTYDVRKLNPIKNRNHQSLGSPINVTNNVPNQTQIRVENKTKQATVNKENSFYVRDKHNAATDNTNPKTIDINDKANCLGTKQPEPTTFNCDLCSQKFRKVLELSKHRKTHSEMERLKCSACGKVMPNDDSMKAHRKIHTDNLHPCDKCGKILSSKSGLMHHLKTVHSDTSPFCCQICGKSTKTFAHLQTHLTSHSNDRPFVCSSCGVQFKTHATLKQHSLIHLGRTLICEICGHKCRRRSHLSLHMQRHKNDKAMDVACYCTVCHLGFTSRDDMLLHQSSHSDGEMKKSLEEHVEDNDCCRRQRYETHGDNKDFVCRICSQSLSSMRALKYHERTHTGELPFTCRYCGKGFKGKECWLCHERMHRGERPFKCNICGKGFRNGVTLCQHRRTHEDKKRFTCTICNFGTSRPAALRVHSRVHTNERPYSCHACDKTYKYSMDYKKHITTCHNAPSDSTLKD